MLKGEETDGKHTLLNFGRYGLEFQYGLQQIFEDNIPSQCLSHPALICSYYDVSFVLC